MEGRTEAEPEPAAGSGPGGRPKPSACLWHLREWLYRRGELHDSSGWFVIDERTRQPIRAFLRWEEGAGDYVRFQEQFQPLPEEFDWHAVEGVGLLVGAHEAVAAVRMAAANVELARGGLERVLASGLESGQAAWEQERQEGEQSAGGEPLGEEPAAARELPDEPGESSSAID